MYKHTTYISIFVFTHSSSCFSICLFFLCVCRSYKSIYISMVNLYLPFSFSTYSFFNYFLLPFLYLYTCLFHFSFLLYSFFNPFSFLDSQVFFFHCLSFAHYFVSLFNFFGVFCFTFILHNFIHPHFYCLFHYFLPTPFSIIHSIFHLSSSDF